MFKVMIPSLMLASIALAQPRDLAPRAGGMLHACVSMFQAPQQFMAPRTRAMPHRRSQVRLPQRSV